MYKLIGLELFKYLVIIERVMATEHRDLFDMFSMLLSFKVI
jgi:hypothetical protein